MGSIFSKITNCDMIKYNGGIMKNYAQALSKIINQKKEEQKYSEEYLSALEKIVDHQELSIREKNVLAMEMGVPFVPNLEE